MALVVTGGLKVGMDTLVTDYGGFVDRQPTRAIVASAGLLRHAKLPRSSVAKRDTRALYNTHYATADLLHAVLPRRERPARKKWVASVLVWPKATSTSTWDDHGCNRSLTARGCVRYLRSSEVRRVSIGSQLLKSNEHRGNV